MKQFFESTVKEIRVDESGRERKVTDQVIFEAVSFTDAEAKVTEAFPDGQIKAIKLSKVIDVIGEGEKYFKAVIALTTIDEVKGKEKQIKESVLFGADDIESAKVEINKFMADILVSVELKSITETKIVEVL